MQVSDIEERLTVRPFVPFRLHVPGGSAYEVCHPGMAMVSRRVIAVGVYGSPGESRFERIAWCDPLHVTRIEPIDGDN